MHRTEMVISGRPDQDRFLPEVTSKPRPEDCVGIAQIRNL